MSQTDVKGEDRTLINCLCKSPNEYGDLVSRAASGSALTIRTWAPRSNAQSAKIFNTRYVTETSTRSQ